VLGEAVLLRLRIGERPAAVVVEIQVGMVRAVGIGVSWRHGRSSVVGVGRIVSRCGCPGTVVPIGTREEGVRAMPSKRANVKNEKQYEGLKKKGMSKSRAAKIANSPGASKRGGKSSGSSQSKKSTGSGSGGNRSQKAAAGRKGGKATARKRSS
jgi:hypothetical protein